MDILKYLEEKSKFCKQWLYKPEEIKNIYVHDKSKYLQLEMKDMTDKAYYYFGEHTNIERSTSEIVYNDDNYTIQFFYNNKQQFFVYDPIENNAAVIIDGKRSKFMPLTALVKAFNNKEL